MNRAALALDSTRTMYGISIPIPQQSGHNDFVMWSAKPTASVTTRELFLSRSRKWKAETSHLSYIAQRINHPEYRKILSMGTTAVPYILEELERDTDHWFHALALLTGENPIPRDFKGTVKDAARLWIRWGRERYAY